MATFPTLSFACPVDWNSMQGDERERFCAKCARTVVNLSALTEGQRTALLATAKPGELCVAYYRRLTGEFVTAERPLSAAERRGAAQYGLASLSAAALLIAATCVAKNPHAVAQAGAAAVERYEHARADVGELRQKLVERFTGKPPRPKHVPLVMFAGVMACPSPTSVPPIPMQIPPTASSSPAESPSGETPPTRT